MRSEAEHSKPASGLFALLLLQGGAYEAGQHISRFKAEQHVRHALVQSGCRGSRRLAQQSIQGEYCAV